ncbi:unnamed protein product [Nezara viridula]|uniref:Uncharacterized protein n=1 Tax=Nezara viridula TaxID=85310 RepID=A0A9P0E246_NEZVI|nr:unnamed protein product [Nezara viridula]
MDSRESEERGPTLNGSWCDRAEGGGEVVLSVSVQCSRRKDATARAGRKICDQS